MHRPLRIASAEHATLMVAAAYEGAVTTDYPQNPAVTCADEGVRFGGYNGRVMTTNDAASTPAAMVVAR